MEPDPPETSVPRPHGFLRLVRFRIREGSEQTLFEIYRDRVIPSLAGTDGCRLVALLAPWSAESHASLTLWDDPRTAAAYEDRGVYQRLLRELEPILSPGTEWRVHEPSDPSETLDPDLREIPPDGYTLAAGDAAAALGTAAAGLFVRFAAIRLRPDRDEEFLDIYRASILPALEGRPGWCGGFLARAARQPSDILSVTTWRREADAVRYEMSGEFERLSRRAQETFAELGRGAAEAGPLTPRTESFQLVVGRRLDAAAPL